MGTARHLSKAPIQEALIDIQFTPDGAPDVALIASYLAGAYDGKIGDIWKSLVHFERNEDGIASQVFPTTKIGKRIDIPSRNQVLQLRENGFTFSRLPPYQDWDELKLTGLDVWRSYAVHALARQVTQVALRYINALDLPLPFENFSDYLEAAPPVPAGVPQVIGDFLTRVIIQKGEDLATITQLSQGTNPEKTALRVTLDIEIVSICDLRGDDFIGLTEILDRQRVYKNEIFFAHLTNKILEIYE